MGGSPIFLFKEFLTNRAEAKKFQKLFLNDVKKHIKDVAKKYVLPEEGTLDFALMYVPSESVYYEVVNLPELIEYARRSRVYIVSPSTLYAVLQTILLSFEGKRIEQQAREVFRLLRAIQQDYQKTESEMSVLGKHIGNAYSKMNEVFQRFSLLGQKITSATQLPQGKERKQIED